MKFLSYLGEFFLFRRLFGKFRKSATEHDTHTGGTGTSVDRDSEYLNGNHDDEVASIEDAATAVGDAPDNDSDNSEELDDLDIFMRDNEENNRIYPQHGDYGSDYHSSGRYSDHDDWDTGTYDESYDDFLDEQDDFDMMDDDF